MNNIQHKLMDTLSRIGSDPQDSDELKTWKVIIIGDDYRAYMRRTGRYFPRLGL